MTSKTTQAKTYVVIERPCGAIERSECTQRPFFLAANSPTQTERRQWWDKINTAMAQASKGKVLRFEIEEVINHFVKTQEAKLWQGINEGAEGWEPEVTRKLIKTETKTTVINY